LGGFSYEKAKLRFDIGSLMGYVYAATVASSLTTVITNPFRVLNTKMIVKKKDDDVVILFDLLIFFNFFKKNAFSLFFHF